MASFTVRIGVLLVVLGVASYGMTGGASLTALIPSIFGAALGLCGALAHRSRTPRPLALRIAILIAGMGFAATATALSRFIGVVASGAGTTPALVSRASMALLLFVYLLVSVRAFVRDALHRK